jgi:hypothetical protein
VLSSDRLAIGSRMAAPAGRDKTNVHLVAGSLGLVRCGGAFGIGRTGPHPFAPDGLGSLRCANPRQPSRDGVERSPTAGWQPEETR